MADLPSAVPGRRELRKRETRASLLRAAEELFGRAGYDEVTVAEIAARAGVSVKTLFQHFASKEDLLFGDQEPTRDQIIAEICERPPGTTPLDAVTGWLLARARESSSPDALEDYHRSIGSSPAIASRLRRLWEQYETAIARQLADEHNEADPSSRPAARDSAHRPGPAYHLRRGPWICRPSPDGGSGHGDRGLDH